MLKLEIQVEVAVSESQSDVFMVALLQTLRLGVNLDLHGGLREVQA